VDVAGVALALVELGHKGDGVSFLSRYLLRAVLVDRVSVCGREGAVELEVDLVLPEVALALGVLHREPGRSHGVPDAPQQRLDARRPEQRVVHIVVVGGLEVPIPLAPRFFIRVHEDEELQLRPDEGFEAALGEALELALEDLARRRHHCGAVLPHQVARHERRPLLPGHDPHRREIRLEDEVAVAPLPRGHRVALHGVHVHVHGQEIVAPFGVVLDDLVEEVGRGEPLALQPPLHVRHRYEDGVYPSGVNL
jgi:hypothetical protein